VAKKGESLEVEGYLYSSPKNLPVGLKFKFWTKSGGAKQYSAGTLCKKMGALSGRDRQCPVGSDNVRLEVSVCGWIGKDLKSLDSIIFISSNMLLLIVRYSYTQET
jgi:hypothetical protein